MDEADSTKNLEVAEEGPTYECDPPLTFEKLVAMITNMTTRGRLLPITDRFHGPPVCTFSEETFTIAELKHGPPVCTFSEETFTIAELKCQWEHISPLEAAIKSLGRSEFPGPLGKESTDGKKGRGTVIIGNSFIKSTDKYSFIQSQRAERIFKMNGNDIFRDQNSDYLKAEAIYKMTKWEGNEWTIFATEYLGIPAKKLRDMRREVGSLTTKFKMESLKYWSEKNGSNGTDLVALVKKFMRCTEVTSDIKNIPFEDVCRAVVGLIGDESWMKFVRIVLGLTEDEIKELRMEYADFTEEQKYQIIKRWIQHEKKIRRNHQMIRVGGLQHERQG